MALDFDSLDGRQESSGCQGVCTVVGRSGARGAGPYMQVTLRFDGKTVTLAEFLTLGCPTAMRCGDWVAMWAVGKPPSVLALLEPADLITVIGGVPLGKECWAEATVRALQDGLAQIRVASRRE